MATISPFPGMDPFLEDPTEWGGVLTTIAIPLRQPFSDVPLDLASANADAYRRGNYANDIDYTGAVPEPGLRPPIAQWVSEQVAAWKADALLEET